MLPIHVMDGLIQHWISEDIPSFDYGARIVEDYPTTTTTAYIYGKSKGVLSGIPFVERLFHHLNCTIEWSLKEGMSFTPIQGIAKVTGPTHRLLQGERIALNILARSSGISTR